MMYLYFICSYLIGSISFAILTSKFYHLDDPRLFGSNNAGATNVMRSGNKKAGLLTFVGDTLKGTIVVIIGKYIFFSQAKTEIIVSIGAILVILGHIYPVFYKFKGGKGVATLIGIVLGVNPILFLASIGSWGIVFTFFRISSLSSLITISLIPLYSYLIMGNNPYTFAMLLCSLIVLYKHKGNIKRLLNKNEHKFK